MHYTLQKYILHTCRESAQSGPPIVCFHPRVSGHVITKCPQIDSEVKDGFIKHVGQQMLDKDFVKQPQLIKLIQKNLEERMQEIILGEGQFVQNKLKIWNSPNVNIGNFFFVKLNSIPKIVQINVVQLEAKSSKKLTPSSRMPKMMSGIP
jgi:hypothetical protein